MLGSLSLGSIQKSIKYLLSQRYTRRQFSKLYYIILYFYIFFFRHWKSCGQHNGRVHTNARLIASSAEIAIVSELYRIYRLLFNIYIIIYRIVPLLYFHPKKGKHIILYVRENEEDYSFELRLYLGLFNIVNRYVKYNIPSTIRTPKYIFQFQMFPNTIIIYYYNVLVRMCLFIRVKINAFSTLYL